MAVKCPMKEAGNGHGAALQTGLCASQVHYSLWKHRVLELVSNSYQFLGFPICFFKLSVSSNLFSNDTLHYKWWHLTNVAFPYLHQQKKFTRHNSIQSWHLVIAIKHEGHPFYFLLYKLSEHNFIHIKKIIFNLIWPTHSPISFHPFLKPFITSPTPSPDYRIYK